MAHLPPKPEYSTIVPQNAAKISKREWAAVSALLLGATIALFLTSPRAGDFSANDAPRHAMDGVFYKDFLTDFPIQHPRQYAVDYYLHAPALTILFYPPVFALTEAGFYAVFGTSASTAQLTVAAFCLLAAAGGYLLLRMWYSPLLSLAGCFLFLGAPEVALWGRQVFLELPCLAFLLWSSHFLFRYLDTKRPSHLYFCTALLILGVYTKQTILFMVLAFLAALYCQLGWSILKQRPVLISLALFASAMIPLVIWTAVFGRANLESVGGGAWAKLPRFSLASWSYCGWLLPRQLGWPTLALGIIGAVPAFLRNSRLPRAAAAFCFSWLGVGYVFFSMVALKEPRHSIVILFPIVVMACHAFACVPVKNAAAVALVFGALVFGWTLKNEPVPFVRGYQEAVEYIASHAPRNSTVLFSGYRDGNFIYNLWVRRDRRDIVVLRADKVLLQMAVKRELGIRDRGLSAEGIAAMLNRYGVTYVVAQPNFWDDLPAMQRLQAVLHEKDFKLVSRVDLSANTPELDRTLDIYENLGPVNRGKVKLALDLGIIGTSIEGDIGMPSAAVKK